MQRPFSGWPVARIFNSYDKILTADSINGVKICQHELFSGAIASAEEKKISLFVRDDRQ
jgi:hypothetical protein